MGNATCKCCDRHARGDDLLRSEVGACTDEPPLLYPGSVPKVDTAFVDAASKQVECEGDAVEKAVGSKGEETKGETAPEQNGTSEQAAAEQASDRPPTDGLTYSVDGVEAEFLNTIPMFRRCLTDDCRRKISKAMQKVTFQQSDTFIREGDDANELFVVVHGMVGVYQLIGKEPRRIASLQDGDVFGEAALVKGGHRNASLVAETDVVCFSISRESVKDLGLSDALEFTKRRAVGREGNLMKSNSLGTLISSGDASSVISTNSEDERLVSSAFLHNKNLKHLVPSDGSNFAKEVMQSCRRIEVEKDQVVIEQGDNDADHFYIIESGSLTVTIMEVKKKSLVRRTNELVQKRVGVLKEGESFGELALLYRAPRTATITALEPSTLLSLDRCAFQGILKKATLNRTKENVKYFNGLDLLSYLSAAERRLAATAFESVHFVKGDHVFKMGDPAEALYVLLDGKVEVTAQKKRAKSMEANFNKKKWQYLGQAALISTSRRDSTVKVVSEKAKALMLDRDAFSMVLGGSKTRASTKSDVWLSYLGVLNRTHLMKSFPDDVKEAVARAVKLADFARGSTVFRKGDASSLFYILTDGCVELLDGKSCTVYEAIMHLGDKDIFDGHARRSSAKVISDSASFLTLDHEVFIQLLSPYKNTFSNFWQASDDQILKKDLVMGGLIERTSLGPEEICTHSKTGTHYVLKTMRKDLIVQEGLKQAVMRERAMWLEVKSPFVVRLRALYNEPHTLHFLSEFVSTGSLAELYHVRGFHGMEQHARFHIAGVVCALRHIHKKRFVHRDVKPENVLVSKSGYPKLHDFVLAKSIIGKTFTVCGTPEYMAPEVFCGTGQTRSVDWWSVGVMTFELMTGHTPFRASDQMHICAKVMEGINHVEFPPTCSGAVAELIHKLCHLDPEARLSGAPNVMSHEFFSGFDWQAMASQSLEPPFRLLDSCWGPAALEFSVKNHDLPPNHVYHADGSGWDRGFAANVGLLGSGSGMSGLDLDRRQVTSNDPTMSSSLTVG